MVGLDGLLVGLTLGYVAVTAIGAPSHHLGVPWPLAILAIGGLVGAVALAGALVAILAAGLIGWLGRRLGSVLEARGRPGAAAVLTWPFRTIAGLPAPWIGALAVLLWIGLAGRTMGPLGLFTPPGMASTFVYAIGLAAALLAMARALRPVGAGRARRSAAGLLAIAASALVVGLAAYAVWPGSAAGLVPYDPAFDRVTAVGPGIAADLDDPGARGPVPLRALQPDQATRAVNARWARGPDVATWGVT